MESKLSTAKIMKQYSSIAAWKTYETRETVWNLASSKIDP